MTDKVCCSLTEAERVERRQFFRKALIPRVLEAEDLAESLRLTFPADLKAEVEELISLEKECCDFLSFSTAEVESKLVLTISGSPEAKSTLEMFASAFGR